MWTIQIKKYNYSWVWWPRALFLAYGSWSSRDHEFETCLGYKARCCFTKKGMRKWWRRKRRTGGGNTRRKTTLYKSRIGAFIRIKAGRIPPSFFDIVLEFVVSGTGHK